MDSTLKPKGNYKLKNKEHSLLKRTVKNGLENVVLIESQKCINDLRFIIDTNADVQNSEKYVSLSNEKLPVNIKNGVLGRDIDNLEMKERTLTDDLFGERTERSRPNTNAKQYSFNFWAKYVDDDNDSNDQVLCEDSYGIKRKAAWFDHEDKSTKLKHVVASYSKVRGTRGIRETSEAIYEESLKEKFSQVFGETPLWSQLDSDEKIESDVENDIAKKTSKYLAQKCSLQKKLSKNNLKFKMIQDINRNSYNEGNLINAIDFDADMKIALVAGSSGNNLGSTTLFQLDGKKNYKIKNVLFPNYPIKCAKFMLKKRQFVVGSHLYGRFYVYDIEDGKKIDIPWQKSKGSYSTKTFEVSPNGKYIAFIGSFGEISFFDCDSFNLYQTLRVPCGVNAITFSSDTNMLYTIGDNGQVYVFDLINWRCVHSFYDDGCVEGTAIASSPDGNYLACGSSSGVVNVYDRTTVTRSESPMPLKAVGALVTPVTTLAFNPTSEIIAIASSYKENAFKLVHTASLTVFPNFPGGFAMKRIQTVAFSPDGKYLTAGTNHGVAHLWRLLHY